MVAAGRRSLALRLVTAAGLWAAAALLAAGILLSALFGDAVERGFDARLGVILDSLIGSAELTADGALDLALPPGEERFTQPYSGWYWQVSLDREPVLRSRSLWDRALPGLVASETPERRGEISGPRGERLRSIERDVALPDSPSVLRFQVAAVDAELVEEQRNFQSALVAALGLLGLALVAALWVQVRFALEPFGRLRRALAAVRGGREARLKGAYPVEIAPLIDELNALLDHNDIVLVRARSEAANLAHALKTPLAVLANEAGREHGALAETAARQVDVMRQQVDRHLARARAAGGQVLGARADIAPVADELRRTALRVHADKRVDIDFAITQGVAFRGDRQDLAEMLGNLLDNACKWARGKVRLDAGSAGGRLTLSMEDDGPGLSATGRDAVLTRGTRLDESVPGSGLGLAITRELAELYGGNLTLSGARLGGLRAVLDLPASEEIVR
ncbi:MAG: HAMP domain-containing histidine kinase [Rhodospirillaceae bacterium]|nr:HAMP domain-containing histidine kinase [Rhodospirillaceae bacterium]